MRKPLLLVLLWLHVLCMTIPFSQLTNYISFPESFSVCIPDTGHLSFFLIFLCPFHWFSLKAHSKQFLPEVLIITWALLVRITHLVITLATRVCFFVCFLKLLDHFCLREWNYVGWEKRTRKGKILDEGSKWVTSERSEFSKLFYTVIPAFSQNKPFRRTRVGLQFLRPL